MARRISAVAAWCSRDSVRAPPKRAALARSRLSAARSFATSAASSALVEAMVIPGGEGHRRGERGPKDQSDLAGLPLPGRPHEEDRQAADYLQHAIPHGPLPDLQPRIGRSAMRPVHT